MSSGVKVAAARGRGSPSSVKKTIENIKDITGPNHSEDEIYAMLKECSMDPNETAQKLLLLDTFHEVKKKRDRRKENLNKEPAEARWNPGSQARVSRPGRENYSSRHVSYDAGGGRHSSTIKQSYTSQISQKIVTEAPLANAQETKKNEASSSESPSGVTSQITNSIHENHFSARGGVNLYNDAGSTRKSMLEGSLLLSSPVGSSKNPDAPGTRDIRQNEMLDSSDGVISLPSIPASGSHFSSSDPIRLPSQDVSLPSAVGTIGWETGSKHTPVELIADILQVADDFQGVGKTQNVESVLTPSSITVGPGKEWKPKSTTPSVDQGASTTASSEVSTISGGSRLESQRTPRKATLELQRKLEELDISDRQNVIIPNHLQVPNAGKLGFFFGSFDANFGLDMNQRGGLGSETSPLLSESYEVNEEPTKELQLSNQTVLAAAENTETKYHEHTQSLVQEPGVFSYGDVEVSSSTTPGYSESKQEITLGSHQHPVIHTSSNYNYVFMTPILSNQLTPFESSEVQARGVARPSGFVVQQPFDREGDISDLHSAMASNECNGNAALLSAREVGNPPFLSMPSPVPIVMQSSVTTTQQSFPIFYHPTGIHLPHYPPFIPYSPYFSPYYVPSPAIHQFLSNDAFPVQHLDGSLYPTPPGTIAKSSVSQHKQGSNTGSLAHGGVAASYGPYGLFVPNYDSSSVTAVTSTSDEDLGASQGKENNINLIGQQNENSGIVKGRLAFTPTQPGYRPFTGIFHPAPQGTAANLHPLLVGPTANVYQLPPAAAARTTLTGRVTNV